MRDTLKDDENNQNAANAKTTLFFRTWARTFKCLWGPGIDSKEW
jgi:hypothetical protein